MSLHVEMHLFISTRCMVMLGFIYKYKTYFQSICHSGNPEDVLFYVDCYEYSKLYQNVRQKSKWPSLKQRDAGLIATWVCSSNIKVKLEQIDFELGKKNLIVSIVMGKMFRSLHLFGCKVHRELGGSLWCTRPGFESNFRVTVFGEKGRNKYEWETIKLSSCP